MNEKNHDKYTETEEKRARKVIEDLASLKLDDLQKIFWIMKGMQISAENAGNRERK